MERAKPMEQQLNNYNIMKKIFVNPTAQVLGIELESHILGGSSYGTDDAVGGNGVQDEDKQDPSTGTDGLARPMGGSSNWFE